MKFLLTSNGLSNPSIAKALFELVGKEPAQTKVAFIPTAMNVTPGNKSWFVNDLYNINKQGLEKLSIVDISALPKEVWLPRLEEADVLFFSGGSSYYLMNWIRKSGLVDLLPELLKTRVWAGISAGSMVTNPSLVLSSKDVKVYFEETFEATTDEALGFVDLYVRPHYNSPDFPNAREEYLREISKDIQKPIYGLDDMSALKITNEQVEIVSEGKYLILNK